MQTRNASNHSPMFSLSLGGHDPKLSVSPQASRTKVLPSHHRIASASRVRRRIPIDRSTSSQTEKSIAELSPIQDSNMSGLSASSQRKEEKEDELTGAAGFVEAADAEAWQKMRAMRSCLEHLSSVMKSATDQMLQASAGRSSETLTRASNEAAAASVAVLEGTENVLRLAAIENQSCESDVEQLSSMRDATAWKLVLRTVAEIIHASIATLRGFVFDSLPSEPVVAQSLGSVPSVLNQRLREFHRYVFARPRFSAHESGQILADNETHQQEKQSSGLPLTRPMSARIQNCDRILSQLKVSRFSRLRAERQQHQVWADAEDALWLLRLRFLFAVWRIVTRRERQHKMNVARIVEKMAALKKRDLCLRVFLQFKQSIAMSKAAEIQKMKCANETSVKQIAQLNQKLQLLRDQRELAITQYQATSGELEKFRQMTQLTRQCPMMFDFRSALFDVASNRRIESGIIEFQRRRDLPSAVSASTCATFHGNVDETNSKHQHCLYGSQSGVYPPFVDFCAPQSEHALGLVQAAQVERCARQGIAIPGFRPDPSYYEIRVTQGNAHDLFSDSLQTRSGSTSPRPSQTENQHANLQHLAAPFFSDSLTLQRWDVEFCLLIEALLKKLQPLTPNEDVWDINEPFAKQIAKRALAVKLGVTADLCRLDGISDKNNQDHTKQTQSSPDESSNDDGEEEQAKNSPQSGMTNATTSAPSDDKRGAPSLSSFHTAAADAVEASIRRAQEFGASSMQQLHEAAEKFVTTSVEKFIELSAQDEEELKKKNFVRTRKSLNDENANGTDHCLETREHFTNHRCAVASAPPLALRMLMRSRGLLVDSPADLILQPEIAVRVFVVLFGLRKVVDELKNQPNHSTSFAEIATTLLRRMPFSGVFPMNKDPLFSNLDETQQTQHTASRSQMALRNGRWLCAMIQSHIAMSLATAEVECESVRITTMSSPLLLRRLQSGKLR